LIYWLIEQQNKAFTWNDLEKGKFKEEFFSAIEIPMVVHVLWVEHLFRIPFAIYKEVCSIIKMKLDTRVYEFSNLSYRLRWFCIIKKDRKSLRIVYSLKLLNRVTIVYLRLSPATEELAMHFVKRACNKILDLYMGYNK